MILVPFDHYDRNVLQYESDYNYLSTRDKHISKILDYVVTRLAEVIGECNKKEEVINILGMQVDHLTGQMEELANFVGEAAKNQDFESLEAIEKWLTDRKDDKRNSTRRLS